MRALLKDERCAGVRFRSVRNNRDCRPRGSRCGRRWERGELSNVWLGDTASGLRTEDLCSLVASKDGLELEFEQNEPFVRRE